jgi:hypothetical protein
MFHLIFNFITSLGGGTRNGRDFYGNMLNGEKLGYEEKQLALGCFI